MLDVAEIKRLIDEDKASTKKALAKIGQRYYEGDHDIKRYRMFYYNADGELVEDTYRSNIRISHPFFTELTDQFIAHLLSNKKEIITAKADGLQEHLDLYFNKKFWAEFADLLTGCYVKGFEYFYCYKGQNDRLTFECADSLGVVEVRAKETNDKTDYYIWAYVDRIGKDNKKVIKIQVHTAQEIYYFEQLTENGKIELDKDIQINPRPNVVYVDEKGNKYGSGLGFIPFFRLDYNKKQISGVKPVKEIIDNYDLMQCGLSNNIQDFDTPIHCVKGFEGDNLDQLQTNLKTKKMVGTDAEGGIDVVTVDIPYEARKIKADEDKRNIYHFGMGVDTQALKDSSATTNLAIQQAYSLLDLKADIFATRRIESFLENIVQIVIDEINLVNGTGYQISDVDIEFKPSTMINETENIQNEKTKAETKQIEVNTILNVAAQVGDEATLKGICDVLDLDYEEIQAKVEKSVTDDLNDAQNTLNGVVIEEPVEEGGVE